MIYLIIPDVALREAIAEGIKIAKLGDMQTGADMATVLKDGEALAIVIDEIAADKKALKIFQDAEGKKKRAFLLGEAAGWDDHPAVESFAKPLRLGHLLSRVSFHLGNAMRRRDEAISIGGWRFEPQNRQMIHDDETVMRLTEKETALLDYLVQSDAPAGREELLAAVWGHDGRIETHTLETHIYQLRRKLGDEGNLLANENGLYCLKRLEARG